MRHQRSARPPLRLQSWPDVRNQINSLLCPLPRTGKRGGADRIETTLVSTVGANRTCLFLITRHSYKMA